MAMRPNAASPVVDTAVGDRYVLEAMLSGRLRHSVVSSRAM